MSVRTDGWGVLFTSAFAGSRNAMALVDARRRILDVNAAYVVLLGHPRDRVIGRPLWTFVAGGPKYTPAEWARSVAAVKRVTGETDLINAAGERVPVQWASTGTVVDGSRVVLLVALSTARWGRHFRRDPGDGSGVGLTRRERDVVTLVASGATTSEVADELGISAETARTHVRNAMAKVGARSRAHLVAKAIGDDLLVDSSPA